MTTRRSKKMSFKGGAGGGGGGGGGGVTGGGGGGVTGGGGGGVNAYTPTPPSSSDEKTMPSFHIPNFQFFSMISPYILVGFFFLLSFFNTNLKGIAYLIGLIVLLFLSGLVGAMFPGSENSKAVCGLFSDNLKMGSSLPFGLIVYGFTFSYLFFPMIQTTMMNYPLIIGLLMLIGIDVTFLTSKECVSFNHIMIAIAMSIIFGFVWYLCVQSVSPSLLYHVDYLSDKQVCSMPSQQKFKCSVYKNGELITTTTK